MKDVLLALCCWVVVRLFVSAGLFPVLTPGIASCKAHKVHTSLVVGHPDKPDEGQEHVAPSMKAAA
jgi:hypothetical protein